MKKNELLSTLRSLQSSKGRTSLAVAVGVLAMLLLLLSELLPGGDTQKAVASGYDVAIFCFTPYDFKYPIHIFASFLH